MKDWVAELAGEQNQKYQRAALVLRTLGWIAICWAAMVSIWIWMGYKAGANLWLWSTLGLFVAGAICLGIAGQLQTRAGKLVAVPETAKQEDDHLRAA
jgi:hypothetical protein